MFAAATQMVKGFASRFAGGAAVSAEGAGLKAVQEVVAGGVSSEAKQGLLEGVKGFFKGHWGKMAVGGAGVEGISWWTKISGGIEKALPLALIAGLAGGAYLLFKGNDKPKQSAEHQAQVLSPQQSVLQPQMGMTVGNTVTAAYPAAVGTVGLEQAQSAPQANWAARVGQRSAFPMPIPQESYAQDMQLQAEQAAMQQNGVA